MLKLHVRHKKLSRTRGKHFVFCNLLFAFVAVWPGVQRGDPAECNQECDTQRALHCADRRAGSHLGLLVLHCGLHFFQRRLHPGGGSPPQLNPEWGLTCQFFLPKNITQRRFFGLKILAYLPTVPFCFPGNGGSLASEFLSTGMCRSGIDENCTAGIPHEGTLSCSSGVHPSNVYSVINTVNLWRVFKYLNDSIVLSRPFGKHRCSLWH